MPKAQVRQCVILCRHHAAILLRPMPAGKFTSWQQEPVTPFGFLGFLGPADVLARGCWAGEKASLALRCLLALGCPFLPGDSGDLGVLETFCCC